LLYSVWVTFRRWKVLVRNAVNWKKMNCWSLTLEEAVALEVAPEVEVVVVVWEVQQEPWLLELEERLS
jgi:hypothetical protein